MRGSVGIDVPTWVEEGLVKEDRVVGCMKGSCWDDELEDVDVEDGCNCDEVSLEAAQIVVYESSRVPLSAVQSTL